jgi:hypothetical protein
LLVEPDAIIIRYFGNGEDSRKPSKERNSVWQRRRGLRNGKAKELLKETAA